MNREKILSILYDISLVTGGETRVDPLLSATLQKFMYHTSFQCGLFLSQIESAENSHFQALLEKAICSSQLADKENNKILLPGAILHSKNRIMHEPQLLQQAFSQKTKYQTFLYLPVDNSSGFLLLNKTRPSLAIPEQALSPVLRNFSNILSLCRQNEAILHEQKEETVKYRFISRELEEYRNMQQLVLNSIPSRVFYKDKNSIYLGCNRLFAQDAGLGNPELIVGKTDFDLAWGKTPEAELFRKYDQEVISSGKPKLRYIEQRTRPDGSVSWEEISKIPLTNKSREIIGVLGTYHDITERVRIEEELKESEQRLSLHVQHTPLGAIDWDLDFRVMEWNQSAEKIFGYKREDTIGKHASELINIAKQHMQASEIWNNLLNLQGGEVTVIENKTREGKIIVCEWHNTPLIDKAGKVIGVSSLVQDITEKKEIEKEIIKSRIAAETANRAKSEFLSHMSHELRTPLHAILGFTQLIEMGGDEQEIKSYLDEIMLAGEHLLNLINDILDLSKIESGKIDLKMETIDLTETVNECIKLIQPLASNANIAIIFNDNFESRIEADKKRLKQSILNLMSNAVKYNRQNGSVTIGIEILNPSYTRLSIEDTGKGIKDKDKTHLFQSFQRLGQENTRIEGTGVGLVITKKLIEAMGAQLDFHSEFGKGSTFWIDFPLPADQ